MTLLSYFQLSSEDGPGLKEYLTQAGMEQRISSYRMIMDTTRSILNSDSSAGSPVLDSGLEDVFEELTIPGVVELTNGYIYIIRYGELRQHVLRAWVEYGRTTWYMVIPIGEYHIPRGSPVLDSGLEDVFEELTISGVVDIPIGEYHIPRGSPVLDPGLEDVFEELTIPGVVDIPFGEYHKPRGSPVLDSGLEDMF